nr:MAG TPA: hypothetical protein [Caudoviricetes sp.]
MAQGGLQEEARRQEQRTPSGCGNPYRVTASAFMMLDIG